MCALHYSTTMGQSSSSNLANSNLGKFESGNGYLGSNMQMFFNVSNQLLERNASRVVLQWAPDNNVVCPPKQSFYTLVGKRIIDFITALFVLIFVLSWLIPLISLAIQRDPQDLCSSYNVGRGGKDARFTASNFEPWSITSRPPVFSRQPKTIHG